MSKKTVIKRKKKPSILIPVILAVIVTYFFWTGAEKNAEQQVQPIPVPFATTTLYEHHEIQVEDITVREVPAQSVPPNVVLDPNALVGMYVNTKSKIPVNGMFFEDNVVNFEEIPSRISMMLEGDNVGLTMRVDLERSVANSLRDDMEVQVRFFTTNTPNGQGFEGVLEERMRILSVRDSRGTDIVNEEDGTVRVPTVVVFDATEEQASYLIRAQQLGQLNLLAISENGEIDTEENEETVEIEELLEEENGEMEQIQQFIDFLSENIEDEEMAEEQIQLLSSLLLGDEASEDNGLIGSRFEGNPVKLYIDSMTFHIEQRFEGEGYFVTPLGEIVIYDDELGELRYFESREVFEGSQYILQEMTDEEIEEYFERISEVEEDTENLSSSSNEDGTRTFRGQGNDSTEKIRLTKGLNLFELTHEGNGDFVVTLIDDNGRETVVVEETGNFSGKKAVSARETGQYVIEVKADGIWEIKN